MVHRVEYYTNGKEVVLLDFDFLDGIGEGAYHSDDENRRDQERTPEDDWTKEFEQMDREEVIP